MPSPAEHRTRPSDRPPRPLPSCRPVRRLPTLAHRTGTADPHRLNPIVVCSPPRFFSALKPPGPSCWPSGAPGNCSRDMETSKGGRPSKTGNTLLPVSTLEDIGVTKMQSSRWQREAELPEAEQIAWPIGYRLTLFPHIQLLYTIPVISAESTLYTSVISIYEKQRIDSVQSLPRWAFGR